MGPIRYASEDNGVRTATGVEPNTICPPFWRISEMPRVTMSWPKCPSSSEPAVRSPETREMRNLCRSAPPAKTMGAAQLALGEVDDAHDAEDEAEADAHQTVDGADRDARGDRVQHVLDQDFEIHRASARLPLGR